MLLTKLAFVAVIFLKIYFEFQRSEQELTSMQPISIDLTDTDPVALRMVLSYIYTDRILPTPEGKQKMCTVKPCYL